MHITKIYSSSEIETKTTPRRKTIFIRFAFGRLCGCDASRFDWPNVRRLHNSFETELGNTGICQNCFFYCATLNWFFQVFFFACEKKILVFCLHLVPLRQFQFVCCGVIFYSLFQSLVRLWQLRPIDRRAASLFAAICDITTKTTTAKKERQTGN